MSEQSVQDARGGARTTRYGRLSFWASVLGVCSLFSDRSSTTRLLRINHSERSVFFQLVHAPLGGMDRIGESLQEGLGEQLETVELGRSDDGQGGPGARASATAPRSVRMSVYWVSYYLGLVDNHSLPSPSGATSS